MALIGSWFGGEGALAGAGEPKLLVLELKVSGGCLEGRQGVS